MLKPEQLRSVDQADQVTMFYFVSVFYSKSEHPKEPKERFIATFQKAATSEYGDSWPAVLLDVLNQTEWAKEIIPRKGSAIKVKP